MDLTLGDVAILALDTRRLATEIATALEIDLDYRKRRGVLHLGRHLISARTGFPVALVLGSAAWRPPLHLHDFDGSAGAILMSSSSSLDPDLQDQLRLRGHRIHVLGEVVGDDDGRVVASAAPAILFRDLREGIAATAVPVPRPRWTLPAGATWEKLKFELVVLGEINVSTSGQTHKLRPEHLGLRNEKTGGFAEGWVLLTTVVAMNGDFSFTKPTNAAEKQMQLLNRALRDGLGLEEVPIIKLALGEYTSRFVSLCSLPGGLAEISGDPLKAMAKKFSQLPRRKRERPGTE